MPVQYNPARVDWSVLGSIGQSLGEGYQQRKQEREIGDAIARGDYQAAYDYVLKKNPVAGLEILNRRLATERGPKPNWKYGPYGPYDANSDAPPPSQAASAAPENPATAGMTPEQKAVYEKKIAEEKAKADVGNPGRENAKATMSQTLETLMGNYLELDKEHAITSTENPVMTNIGAWAGATPAGQTIQSALGTKAQSLRQKIQTMRPGLVNTIRAATGLSAKAMDSNVELQLQLQQATDASYGLEANLAAIDNLDRQYGLGGLLDRVLADKPDVLSRVRGGKPTAGQDEFGFTVGQTREVPGKGTAVYLGNNRWKLQ